MGKKVKVGKQRKDKYYRLAKEAGYRSRAAFKLIQLNKRFEFLQNSRAVVDLCAAPGGWLQVARQNMPMSSLCVGIDLVPIKAINNVITLQGDITTEKARQMIKKELQSWEADCVLHDGAPNIGLNWLHDAFQQNQLVLSALRLATQVLGKNGWFVTKIFRSKDYEAVMGVFEKLFKRVHVWKPAASRLESAEIFVACEKYLKPAKIDPALLDPKAVFKDANLEPSAVRPQDLLQVRKKVKKARAEGYAEGDLTLHHRLKATEFINSKDYLELLSNTNEMILDDPMVTDSPYTTPEVLECLKDVKVCGPRELRAILGWRKKIRESLAQKLLAEEENNDPDNEASQAQEELTPEELEARELAEIDVLIANAKADEKAILKRKKRRLLREKSKERVKKDLKMIIEGDKPDLPEQQDLFSLAQIKRARQLVAVSDAPVPDAHANGDLSDDAEGSDEDEEDDEIESDHAEMNGEEMDEDDDEDNPLIYNDDYGLNRDQKLKKRTDQWFDRDVLANLLDEDEDVAAVEKHMERLKKRKPNGDVPEEGETPESTASPVVDSLVNDENGAEKDDESDAAAESSDDEPASGAFDEEITDSDDDDYDSDDPTVASRSKATLKSKKSKATADFEVVPQDDETTSLSKLKRRKLDPTLLAMGEQLIYSTKTRRDLEEFGWHRFTNNDEGLPDWFVDDEKRHYRKQLPVTKAQMDEYRQRQREFNARPIKKVAEAKMRKRKKEMSKLRLAKKRAQRIVDDPEMEQHEKVREMKKVYQKAATKKPDVSYKVISKGKRGTGARPKGPFKVVDKRLKKDNRKDKEETRKSLWKKKSPEAKRAAMEKNKRSRTGRKADKRTKRRAKRGKTN